ncbi:MAG: hypothetical protein ACXVPU_11390 [Bacteroidia bacterium]
MQHRKILNVILLTLFINFSYGQTLHSVIPSEKTNFCDTLNYKSHIGLSAKIWNDGGVYDDINNDVELFPTPEMRKRGGIKGWNMFRPKTGDIGKIVNAVITKGGPSARVVYVLKIKKYYVAIGCGYITDTNKLDENKELEKWSIEEKERQNIYASGCEFKTNGINDCWNRAGVFKIDVVSETFACDLKSKGIDTIMLCKYIFDNGSLPMEKAFVFWQNKGKGYLKAFFNNEHHEPTENAEVSIEWADIYNYFFINRIDKVTTDPKPTFYMSHSMGYSIQFFSPNTRYFCSRLQDYYWEEDKSNHPKTKLWMLVDNKVKGIHMI